MLLRGCCVGSSEVGSEVSCCCKLHYCSVVKYNVLKYVLMFLIKHKPQDLQIKI